MVMDWLGLINALASVATAIGVFLAGWQIRLAKRQAITQFEDDLTKQYREIIKDIPTDALLGLEISDDEYERTRHAFYRYIDLCNEQVFLRQQGRVCEGTWKLWGDGIESNLLRPAFQKAWIDIKRKSDKDFRELKLLENENYNSDPYKWSKENQRSLKGKDED